MSSRTFPFSVWLLLKRQVHSMFGVEVTARSLRIAEDSAALASFRSVHFPS